MIIKLLLQGPPFRRNVMKENGRGILTHPPYKLSKSLYYPYPCPRFLEENWRLITTEEQSSLLGNRTELALMTSVNKVGVA